MPQAIAKVSGTSKFLDNPELCRSLTVDIGRMGRTAELWAALDHPHVQKLVGYLHESVTRVPFALLAELEARSLEQYVEDEKGSLALETAKRFAEQMWQANAYLHSHPQTVVHKRPQLVSWLVFRGESGEDVLKIGDFSLAESLRTQGTLGLRLRHAWSLLMLSSSRGLFRRPDDD
jgi:Protein tyrosine and serine/threonine kinase